MTAATARHAELARFLDTRAIKRGEFTLVSGKKASYYCDGKQVTFSPEGVGLVVDALLEEMKDIEIDAVGGMDMGATPIVAALALRSQQVGRPLPAFVVRKEAKGHGTQKRIEGVVPDPPCRVAVVDDVITTGGSTLKAIEVIREEGHEVVLALAILDREDGGEEALAKAGVPYRPLVRVSELGLK